MEYIKCTIPREICSFRDKNGCCTMGVTCQKIVEECKECNKVEGEYCQVYINPYAKWSHGKKCPMASHLKKEVRITGKRRVGQQKQKKNR
ncbi:MAG: hypothetical protein DRO67_03635 [Candidatus Asgardarchaeum californiense]|nr:MAG: hypothetical protein DRO67_03635 [Candidatus Asgardarchaeum californiense]